MFEFFFCGRRLNQVSLNSVAFHLSYDEERQGKTPRSLVDSILRDKRLPALKRLIITAWGKPWEETTIQFIIDQLIAHSDRFSGLESLRMGEMDSEDCEISWIFQGDYSKFWKAFPNLKSITIQGGQNLVLGDVKSDHLESVEIFTGGIPKTVIQSITKAKTPNLTKLILYIGVEDYGFDGSMEDIKALVEDSDFPKLEYLGVCNSDLQDEIAELVVTSKYAPTLKTLDLSKGVLSDKGAKSILDHSENIKNLSYLDLGYHYISEEMQKKLAALPIVMDLSNGQEWDPSDDDDDSPGYGFPMFTE
ncbi:STM4015 family protein [Desulfosarcina sp. OttesenSCG-928-B08]|nr:STM4015 family protein [Desulfosarcina sp. OttesenSCG-928-B08]